MSLSRFKGTLVGAVIGDCVGSKFESKYPVKMTDVIKHVNQICRFRKEQKEKGTRPADVYGILYTDDTAMAKNVSASLLDKGKFDPKDMAKRFTEEYFTEPDRGYGGNIANVFKALKEGKSDDVFEPASQQFDGSGSYGNGGAMRIAPAPLFAFPDNNTKSLLELTDSITRITHSNHLAIHGAMLEALAIDVGLRWPQNKEIDSDEFLDKLIQEIKVLEEKHNLSSEPPVKKITPKRRLDCDNTPYCAKLNKIKEFVKKPDLKASEVEEVLGNDVSALGSVPAAVLSFLKAATQSIPDLQDRNPFEQTVIYAISLGGDTDTIASMAAAIAGAFYGFEQIPEAYQFYCEGVSQAETDAERMWQRAIK